MIYKVLAVLIISGLAGIKKPIYGGLAGLITAPAISIIFHSFDLPTVMVLGALGFPVGFLCGYCSWWLFFGSEVDQQNSKPYVMPLTGRAGGSQRGGIIYTDEEEKNAKDNKRPIK